MTVSGCDASDRPSPATSDANATAADDADADDDKAGGTSSECDDQPPDTDNAEASADDLLRSLIPSESGNVMQSDIHSTLCRPLCEWGGEQWVARTFFLPALSTFSCVEL